MRTASAPRSAGAALFALLLAGTAPLAAQTTTPPAPAAPASAVPAGGQPFGLSLEEALRRAEDGSEQLSISRAGVTRARGEQLRARSQRLPQVSATASYSRALASEFESLGGGTDTTSTPAPPENCGSFAPNPALPIEERVDSLERAVECAQNASPFAGLGDLPFGRENTWRLGLDVNQNLFAGGRVAAQNRIADAGRRSAEIDVASTQAQIVLDVTQAYYDAVLADRLVEISEASLAQSERTLEQTRIARQVGNTPEFELLRATVSRDNLRPVVIQRRSDRQLAYTRLRLLLDLPADAPVRLTTPLNDAAPVPVARFATEERPLGDTTVANRAPVQQASEGVRVQEGLLRVARSQRLPTVSLFSQYGRINYPEGTLPDFSLSDFRTNWTVGAQLSVPVFTGGRIRGDELVARANLMEAQARLSQTRAAALLDTRTALERLDAARATWEASAGTVEQAERAYGIAEIRYREGLSTQVELSDSRILLQQAQANRAQAARDLQIARARVALLPYLPLGAGGGTGGGQQFQQQQPQPQQQQSQPQQQGGGAQQASAFGGGA
ncbi:MAG TPA: TolC family protein [Longimicrobium sp.]|nr:TolC family protein [Longimicrobium sp.]